MKNVLITGGAGGIGKEIVKKFITEDYHVYLIDVDNYNAEILLKELGYEKCTYINLDVTNIDSLKQYCSNLDKSFTLNHIITLAGRALPNEWIKFENQNINEIKDSIILNLFGHLNTIHAFYPFLKKSTKDKSVVMISSINAISNFDLPGYSAPKSGLYGFMNAVVKEFGTDGIRINVVSPGTVVTPATLKEPKDFGELLKGTALGHFTTSTDVSKLVFEICNTFCSITGQNFIIDAGQAKMH